MLLEEDFLFTVNGNIKSIVLNPNTERKTHFSFDSTGRIINLNHEKLRMSWYYKGNEAYRTENGKKKTKYTLNDKGNVTQTKWLNDHDLYSVTRHYYDDKQRVIKIERDKNNVDNDLANYSFKTIEYNADTIQIRYNGVDYRVHKFFLDKYGNPKTNFQYKDGKLTSAYNYDYTLDNHGNWIKALVSKQNTNDSNIKIDTIYRQIKYYN